MTDGWKSEADYQMSIALVRALMMRQHIRKEEFVLISEKLQDAYKPAVSGLT
jgi:hypothetical protein